MAVVASQSITDLWACPPTHNLFTHHGRLLFKRYSSGKQKIKNAPEERKSSVIGCFWNYKFKKPGGRRVWSPELSNYSSPGCVTKGRGSSVPKSHCTPVFIDYCHKSQPKCLSVDGRLRKMWHTWIILQPQRRKEILSIVVKKYLTILYWSEISQIEETKWMLYISIETQCKLH